MLRDSTASSPDIADLCRICREWDVIGGALRLFADDLVISDEQHRKELIGIATGYLIDASERAEGMDDPVWDEDRQRLENLTAFLRTMPLAETPMKMAV